VIEPFISKFLSPTKAFRRFSVLLAIHHASDISQHQIGERTHLSSSMVNNYIKLLKNEGQISVCGTTNRNQSYHLTASGHRELIESLILYSADVIRLYGNAKNEFVKLIGQFYKEGIRTVVLFGAAETAEVVYAAIRSSAIRVVGVVDSDARKQGKAFEQLVIQSPSTIRTLKPDAVIVTSFGQQEEICQTIEALVGDSIPIKRLSRIGAMEEAA
jgi:DNA-binding MarR family transcriptional regulator